MTIASSASSCFPVSMQKPRPSVEEKEVGTKPVNRLLAYFHVDDPDLADESEEARLVEESCRIMHREIASAQQDFVEFLQHETQKRFLYCIQMGMQPSQADAHAQDQRRRAEYELRPDLEMRIAFIRNAHEARLVGIHEYLAMKRRSIADAMQDPLPQRA